MAKNFVQDGKTIALVADAADIHSGDPVMVGKVLAVAITDIPAGQTGDGATDGVFLLPKLPADVITAGKQVYIKGGKIQLDTTGADAAGVAWEDAGANTSVVEVKING